MGGGGDPSDVGPGEWLALTVSWPAADVGVVRAVGEIDLLTAPSWARALDAACLRLARHDDDPRRGDDPHRPAGRGRLVCDLTAVEFFGASGLSVLVGVGALAADTGVGLRLVTDDRGVLRLLQLVGLDRTVCIEAHLHAAITHALRRRREPSQPRPGRRGAWPPWSGTCSGARPRSSFSSCSAMTSTDTVVCT